MHFQFLFHFLQSIIVLFDGLAMMIMMTFRIDFFKVFHIGVALFLQYTRKNIQYIRPLNNPLSYLKTKLQRVSIDRTDVQVTWFLSTSFSSKARSFFTLLSDLI